MWCIIWFCKVDIKTIFLFGENDAAIKLNNKVIDRLKASGTDITVKEIKNEDHWLPLTHKESVISEII